MNTRGVILLFGVIVIVLAGIFFFLEGSSSKDMPVIPEDNMDSKDEDKNTFEKITLFRMSEGSTHTYKGTITLPTPCHTLQTMIVIAESYPEQVTLDLTSASNAPVCAQVVTEKEFTAQFNASPNHTIRLTMNGKEIPIEVVDGNPSRTPPFESIELVP